MTGEHDRAHYAHGQGSPTTPPIVAASTSVIHATKESPVAVYTCPMHPEIRRNQPGYWPISGMSFQPLVPSLNADDNSELNDSRGAGPRFAPGGGFQHIAAGAGN